MCWYRKLYDVGERERRECLGEEGIPEHFPKSIFANTHSPERLPPESNLSNEIAQNQISQNKKKNFQKL